VCGLATGTIAPEELSNDGIQRKCFAPPIPGVRPDGLARTGPFSHIQLFRTFLKS